MIVYDIYITTICKIKNKHLRKKYDNFILQYNCKINTNIYIWQSFSNIKRFTLAAHV